MGYRSEIVVRIKHNDPIKMKLIFADCMLQQLPWYKYTLAHLHEWNAQHWNPEEGILLHAEDWKWYDRFDVVIQTEALWHHFNELGANDSSLHGAFIRIGEETDDIDEQHFNDGWNLASVHRSLEYS